MTSPSRSAQFGKLAKSLKKFYKPVVPNAERPVLEHLLFASCLENAHYEKADEAYAALVHTFFDWNEIRVTTVKELAETMTGLPDPAAAAQRVKRVLQGVFETTYAFDLEDLRKKNLGVAVERLEKIAGSTKFSVGYVVQTALGGHWIPVDSGTLAALEVLGLITAQDAQEGVVPGLERAIAKNKGMEFATLLHQLGADFTANPYSTNLHKMLVQIEPEAEGRLPKRRPKEPKPEPPPPEPAKSKAGKAEVAAVTAAVTTAAGADKPKAKKKKKSDEPAPAIEPAKTPAAKGAAAEPKPAEKSAPKPAADEKHGAAKAEKAGEPKASQKAAEHKVAEPKTAEHKAAEHPEGKAAAEGKATPVKKKAVAAKPEPTLPTGSIKPSAATGLSKRKPR